MQLKMWGLPRSRSGIYLTFEYDRRHVMRLKNDMILQINKAAKGDAAGMVEFLNLIGGESDNLLFGANGFQMTAEAEEIFIENLLESDVSALFVGKIEDEIVCVGSIMTSPRERISHQAELSLSVKKKYWGLGIGTYLMEAMISFAKRNGQTEILHLGVKNDNINAINLYKKMGFHEVGRHKNFFKIEGNYYDEILMDLYL
ncbi:MAG: N-acetyltransferase [Paenibacillaceae bacterium]|nr:N-acetyltransferase [Paenibacillaceae bacterium]